MNLWTKMKYNAGQNAGWHACMYSHNIQSRRCFLNARGFVYRPSTLFPFIRSFARWFVRSTTITRDMCPNHDMLYAQFWSGFTFNTIFFGIFDSVHSNTLKHSRHGVMRGGVFAHFFIHFSLHHYIISELPHKRAHTKTSAPTITIPEQIIITTATATATATSSSTSTTQQTKEKKHPTWINFELRIV